MVVYADTSFLFSLYAQDANTGKAVQSGKGNGVTFLLTEFQRYELQNALRLSVFRGHVSLGECEQLLELLAADIAGGVYLEVPLTWSRIFAEAESLSSTYSATLGTRGFDILHVAAAMALGAKAFYTFDERQKALAKKAGLKVRPQ
jgi:predicted nucleic acid-binding protein